VWDDSVIDIFTFRKNIKKCKKIIDGFLRVIAFDGDDFDTIFYIYDEIIFQMCKITKKIIILIL